MKADAQEFVPVKAQSKLEPLFPTLMYIFRVSFIAPGGEAKLRRSKDFAPLQRKFRDNKDVTARGVKSELGNWGDGKRHLAAGAVDTLGGKFSDSNNWALWAHPFCKSRVYRITQFCWATPPNPIPSTLHPHYQPIDSRMLILTWNNAPQIEFRTMYYSTPHSSPLPPLLNDCEPWEKLRAIIHNQLAKGALKALRLAGHSQWEAIAPIWCSAFQLNTEKRRKKLMETAAQWPSFVRYLIFLPWLAVSETRQFCKDFQNHEFLFFVSFICRTRFLSGITQVRLFLKKKIL